MLFGHTTYSHEEIAIDFFQFMKSAISTFDTSLDKTELLVNTATAVDKATNLYSAAVEEKAIQKYASKNRIAKKYIQLKQNPSAIKNIDIGNDLTPGRIYQLLATAATGTEPSEVYALAIDKKSTELCEEAVTRAICTMF